VIGGWCENRSRNWLRKRSNAIFSIAIEVPTRGVNTIFLTPNILLVLGSGREVGLRGSEKAIPPTNG
jgi:hypothetical protein